MSKKPTYIIIIIMVIFYSYYWYNCHITGQPPKNPPSPINPKVQTCGLRVENNPIIKVNSLKTYLVGSYIEHRLKVKTIRTIAIVHRSEESEYQCFICCNGANFSVPAESSIHTDHFNFDYGTADITCKVPETCPTPAYVAITSQSPPGQASLNARALLPIRNQNETHDKFSYEFTVCISTMFDFNNTLGLVEAMEMFKILGVQRVAIYKTNCSDEVQKVLDYYVEQNFVELIPWTISSYIKVSRDWNKNVSPGELHYFGQIAALNDCVYRYMYQSHYVALQDLDELILPMKVKNWTQLLPELEKKYGQNKGFEFENNLFPLSMKETNPHHSPEPWKNVKGINILEHVYSLSNHDLEYEQFKVITNPRLVFSTSVHGFLSSVNGLSWVDRNMARMYHFRNVSSAFLSTHSRIKDDHIKDYADRLIPAVSQVLRQVLGIH